MAIFNRYVKLPEGNQFQTCVFHDPPVVSTDASPRLNVQRHATDASSPQRALVAPSWTPTPGEAFCEKNSGGHGLRWKQHGRNQVVNQVTNSFLFNGLIMALKGLYCYN